MVAPTAVAKSGPAPNRLECASEGFHAETERRIPTSWRNGDTPCRNVVDFRTRRLLGIRGSKPGNARAGGEIRSGRCSYRCAMRPMPREREACSEAEELDVREDVEGQWSRHGSAFVASRETPPSHGMDNQRIIVYIVYTEAEPHTCPRGCPRLSGVYPYPTSA